MPPTLVNSNNNATTNNNNATPLPQKATTAALTHSLSLSLFNDSEAEN